MTLKTYYRIAKKQHPVGHVFSGQGSFPLADRFPRVEEILEGRRPRTSLSRGDSVYMREVRDFENVGVTFNDGYVHEVVPDADVQRRDLYWIGVLQRRYIEDERFRANLEPLLSDNEVADRYWSGAASPKTNWEWVARRATVIEVDLDTSPVRPGPSLLNLFD